MDVDHEYSPRELVPSTNSYCSRMQIGDPETFLPALKLTSSSKKIANEIND